MESLVDEGKAKLIGTLRTWSKRCCAFLVDLIGKDYRISMFSKLNASWRRLEYDQRSIK